MEFINEDSKPRFLLKARSSSSSSSSPHPETLKISKIHLSCCFSAAIVFLLTALSLSSYSSITFSLLIWFSLSLLLAPFAPQSVTGGDPRVGRGDPLPPPAPNPPEPIEPRKRSTVRWNPKPPLPPFSSPDETLTNPKPDPLSHTIQSAKKNPVAREEESASEDFEILKRQISKHPADTVSYPSETLRNPKPDPSKKNPVSHEEWTLEDFDILKRQISKHPAGAPGRWDRVAEAFKGKHGVESVIRAAKSLSAKGPPGDDDSFAQFLKQRKPLDKPLDDAGGGGWSSGEDIALLNALKAFPKDAEMRWEKVSAAVPGKSKAECMRRVAELKRDFRSSKSSES